MTLPARLDLTQASPLSAGIAAHSGGDLTLDAGGVDHLGALSAQVLLAAAQDWARAGHRLLIAPRSTAFDDALAAMGLVGLMGMGTDA